jgi:hypothetical protein
MEQVRSVICLDEFESTLKRNRAQCDRLGHRGAQAREVESGSSAVERSPDVAAMKTCFHAATICSTENRFFFAANSSALLRPVCGKTIVQTAPTSSWRLIAAYTQLNDLGVERTLADGRVAGNWPEHLAPRTRSPIMLPKYRRRTRTLHSRAAWQCLPVADTR